MPVGIKAKLKNLTGQQFGHLTVLSRSRPPGHAGRTFWLCRCACGNEVAIRSDNLQSGRSLSCGCRKAYLAAALLIERKGPMFEAPEEQPQPEQ